MLKPLSKLSTIFRILFVLVLLLVTLAYDAKAVEPTNQGQAEWLVMIYQVADDETLEEDIMFDLQEAEFIGSTDQVQIVAQTDRFNGSFDGMGDWTSTRRYYLTADDDFNTINSEEVADLGEVNMADGDTLVDFITWAVENYPAQKYALIMEDHGAGWPGGYGDPDPGILGADDVVLAELFGYDNIWLMELDKALSEALAQTGIDQLELIGFDACLMGQLEVFTAMAPHARYAVASEEVEPGVGWAYAAFLDELTRNPDMDGAQLGQSIVRHYIDQDVRVPPEQTAELSADVTLAAIDLAAISDVNAALDNFTADLAQIDQNTVAEARAYAQAYESVFGEDVPSSYIDLGHFTQLIQQVSPQVGNSADELLSAIESAVITERHGPQRPGSTGIAINFPVAQQYAIADNLGYNIIAERFVNETRWDEFLTIHFADPRRENINRPQASEEPQLEQEIIEIPGITSDEDLNILFEDIQFLVDEGYPAKEALEIMEFDYGWPPETVDFLKAQGVFENAARSRSGGAVAKPIRVEPLALSSEIATPDQPVLIQTDVSGSRLGYVFSFIGRFLPREDVLIIEDMDYIFADASQETNGVVYPAWPPEGIAIDFPWEPIVFAINDGETSVRALFQPETYDDSPTYMVEGLYTFADSGSSRYAKLFFRDGELFQVFGFTGDNGFGSPREITPKPGDTFTVLEQGFDLSNDATEEAVTREGGTVTFGTEKLFIEETPAPSGNYIVGIIAEDLDGKQFEQYEGLFVVSEDTSAVDGFVPYVSQDVGFALLYPELWSVEEDTNQGTVTFSDADSGTAIVVARNSYPDATTSDEANDSAIQEIIEQIETDGDLENLQFITEEPEDFVLGAFDGKIFDFTYELDGTPFYASIIVATPVPGTTYGLVALVPDENFEDTVDNVDSMFASFDVLISGVSKEQIGPPPPDFGQELFSDDFSDPNSGLIQDEEEQEWGRGYYAPTGQYVFEMKPDPGAIYDFYLDGLLPDEFLLQATTSFEGARDNVYGLIFQLLLSPDEDSVDRFYTFRITGDGFYTVEKVGGEFVPIIDWTFSGAINTEEGVENVLAVEGLGNDSYNLYINGQRVDSFTDTLPDDTATVAGGTSADAGNLSYRNGTFGFIVDNYDGTSPVTFTFDDLIVSTP